jgi:hypothetical protein
VASNQLNGLVALPSGDEDVHWDKSLDVSASRSGYDREQQDNWSFNSSWTLRGVDW